MAQAIHFDTLVYANKLKQAGVPDQQAEAQSEALAGVLESQIATKKNLLGLKFELLTKLNSEISAVKFDLVKWMISLIVPIYILLVTILIKIAH